MSIDIKGSILRLQEIKDNGSKNKNITFTSKDLKAIDVAIASLSAIYKLSNEAIGEK